MGKGRPKGIPKTGGRKIGTPNKIRQDYLERVMDEMDAMNVDPLRTMNRIMSEALANGDTAVALSAAKELAKYVAPQRKAVEHSGPNGEAISHELQFVVKGI